MLIILRSFRCLLKCDLLQQLELVSELEFDLRVIKKWPFHFSTGKVRHVFKYYWLVKIDVSSVKTLFRCENG